MTLSPSQNLTNFPPVVSVAIVNVDVHCELCELGVTWDDVSIAAFNLHQARCIACGLLHLGHVDLKPE